MVTVVAMVRLETLLDSWKQVRQDTVQALEDFPPGELDFKPAAELMSFREIARHILDAGLALSGLLLDGVTDFTVPGFRDSMRKYFSTLPPEAGVAELARELRQSLEDCCGLLGAQTPEFFSGIVTRFDGQQLTRAEMIQFAKEHELTHRAQMFLYLRLKGIVPPTTRRRQARK